MRSHRSSHTERSSRRGGTVRALAASRVARTVAAIVALVVAGLGIPGLATQATAVGTVTPATNPDLEVSCGVDIVLVLDASTSIQQANAVGDVRDAARTFVSAFKDTNTRIGMVRFGTTATQMLPMTTVTSASAANNGAHGQAVNSYTAPGIGNVAYTNWQDAVLKGHKVFDDATDRGVPQLLVFVTDGAPNTYNWGDGTRRNGTEPSNESVNPAITAMNAVKNDGIHVLGVAVGDAFGGGSSGTNRRTALHKVTEYPSPKIFPDTAFDAATTDLIMQEDFSELADDLRMVAEALCDGSLSVTKYTSTQNAPNTYDNGGAGWEFNTVVSPGGDWIDGGGGDGRALTTTETGTVGFQWDAGTPDWTKTATVIETAKNDYTLDHVTCTVNGQAIADPAVTAVQDGFKFDVEVGAGKQVACNVYNKYTGAGYTDVAVTKSVSDDVVTVGDEVTWTVTAENKGPKDTANGVVVTDTLPAGVTYVAGSATTTRGSFDPATGEWAIATLDKGDVETLTFRTTVDAAGTHTNVATRTETDENDTNQSNDSDSATVKGVKANLKVTKAADVDEQVLGESVAWTVTVTNEGPATAKAVQVSDVLPAALDHVSDTATQGSYDEGTGVWSVGDLAKDESATLTIVTETLTTGVVTNEAEATTATPESRYDDNADEDSVKVTVADVVVDKVVSDDEVGVGEQVEWTVTVRNDGDATAKNVVVTDALPAGLTYVSSTPAGAYVGNTWSVGDLAPGAEAELVVTTKVAAAGTFTNEACASTDTRESDGDNNCDDAQVVGIGTDLTVTKTPDVSEVWINGQVVWEVVVTNDSGTDAENVVVVDTLPAGLTVVDSDAQQGSYSTATDTWDIGFLPKGASVKLLLTTTVPGVEGLLTNRVDVSTTTDEEDTSNNSDEASVVVTAADVTVTKVASADEVVLGDTLTWTITATNNGSADAVDVVVTDTLPAGLTVTDVSPAGALVGNVWDVGTLARNGGSASITITTLTTEVGTQVNAVDVTTETPESDESNNSDSDDVLVTVADVAVTKTADADTVVLGDQVVWTITASSNGTADAHDVVVSDEIPAGLRIDTHEASQGSFDPATGVWTVGTLAAEGGSATLTLVSTVTATGEVTNAVCVETSTNETNDADNCGEDTVVVTAPDLVVTKTAGAEQVYVGGSLDWTVTVTNQGDATAADVVVTDTVPEGLTVESAQDPSQGSFDLATAVWTVGALEPGASATLTLSTSVDAAGELTNQVCAETTTPESDTANNCGEDTTTGIDAEELLIEKVNTPEGEVAIGDRIDYTLRVTAPESAPLPYDDVTVSDELPGHDADRPESGTTTYVDGSADCDGVVEADGGTCDVSLTTDGSGKVVQVVWGLGTLQPGQTVDVTFGVTADDQTNGEEETIDLLNAGSVTSAFTEPVESNEVVNVLRLTEVLDEQIPGPGEPPVDKPGDLADPADDPQPGRLADTGIELARMLGLAMLLLLVGAVTMRAARRRSLV